MAAREGDHRADEGDSQGGDGGQVAGQGGHGEGETETGRRPQAGATTTSGRWPSSEPASGAEGLNEDCDRAHGQPEPHHAELGVLLHVGVSPSGPPSAKAVGGAIGRSDRRLESGVAGLDIASAGLDFRARGTDAASVIIGALLLLGLVSVPLAGGRLAALAELRLRLVGVAVGAFAVQIVVVNVLPGGSHALHSGIHVATYAVLGVAVAANLRLPGVALIAPGGP